MTPADLLGELSVKIYEPPLISFRDTAEIHDPTNPLALLVLIIDFETEVSMSGINDFIGNSSGRFADETVVALQAIGCPTQAAILRQILDIASSVGMTHDAIQADRADAHLPEYSVTSFRKLHGDKWEAASNEIRQLESKIDFAEVMSHAELFVTKHFAVIRDAVTMD
ncbi:MAG: DUF4375 domain-containing protein [Phycisphaera sp.]|nr:DUF4375 domain-containing protein [Phycisphaera sp.]